MNNDPQAIVSGHRAGAMLVIAGPGTGKTHSIASCLTSLVRQGQFNPAEILALTFTRKAARVMQERVLREIGRDVDVRISTIHSQAYNLLRLYRGGSKIKVIPPAEAYRLFLQAFREAGVTGLDPQALFHMIAQMKEHLIGPDQYPATGLLQETIRYLYRRYQDLLAEQGGMDFGDLILKAEEAIRKDPDFASWITSMTHFVMLDESQDVSPAQYRLARHLAGKGNILVVGSPAQAIYGWRGARVGELLRAFHRDFPGAAEVTFRVNHRSTETIVRAAGRLGEGYPDAAQESRKPAGAAILLYRPKDQWAEAELVARWITRWLEEGIPPSEIGVLYRAHQQARPLEDALSAENIPYVVSGEDSASTALRDILSYLHLANGAEDLEGPLEQVIDTPPRGLGPNAIAALRRQYGPLTLASLRKAVNQWPAVRELVLQVDRLRKEAEAGTPPARMIDLVLEVTGYQEWADGQIDNYLTDLAIAQIRREAAAFATLAGFLQHARMPARAETGVSLSTIHAAKGREWTAVIVAGVVDGIIPHITAEKWGDIEEERRLLYVAVTRARERLVLSAPMMGGRNTHYRLSRFLWPIRDMLREGEHGCK